MRNCHLTKTIYVDVLTVGEFVFGNADGLPGVNVVGGAVQSRHVLVAAHLIWLAIVASGEKIACAPPV